jgi:hypothetical protein
MDNLRTTIEPKSDQINADDLLAGPITVKITAVKKGPANEQPVQIEIEGHRPYRPCKSMRRVLIACWGDKGSDWIGRSMTLYADPTVKYGGVAVGGIRISHVSHMDRPELKMMLTTTRSRRSEYCVKRLDAAQPETHDTNQRIDNFLAAIDLATNMNRLKTIGNQIKSADEEIRSAVRDAYMQKLNSLKPVEPKAETVDKETGEVIEPSDEAAPTLAEVLKLIAGADTATMLDEACDLIQLLPKNDQVAAIKAAQGQRKLMEG